jgi:amino acid adenylation domain-containing protein
MEHEGNDLFEGFRLSPQQEHLWALGAGKESGVYRVLGTVTVAGDLDPAVLERALWRVVARQEILRTRFPAVPGMALPLQVITEGSGPRIRRRDWSGSTAAEQAERLAVLREEIGREPLDLATGSPLDVWRVTLSPRRHLLLLALPALCADTWTLANLTREIGLACATEALETREARAPLEEPGEPMQYADVAEWLHSLLESPATLEGRKFWRQAGSASNLASPAAALPFAVAAAAAAAADSPAGFTPRRSLRTLPAAKGRALDALAARLGVATGAVLLAAWQILLRRLGAAPGPVVGVASPGRGHEELRGALGPLARHLPLRCEVALESSFAHQVAAAAAALGDLGLWEDYFEGKALPVPFLAFGFEVVPPAPSFVSAGTTFSLDRVEGIGERCELKLCCRRQGEEIGLELQYDAAVLAAADVERLGGWLDALLASAVAAPERAVAELSWVTAEERSALAGWNRTELDFAAPGTLPGLVWAQAERTPERVAVLAGERHLSYSGLTAAADRLARRLAGLGVRPEERVALGVERSLDMVVGILGILRAGGAYVPLDPSYPAERLAFMLADSGVRVLLTQARSEEKLRPAFPRGGEVLCLDRPTAGTTASTNPEVAGDEAPLPRVDPAGLAYVIYTSGSTGRPKGVMMAHGAIANRLLWMARSFPLAAADGVLQKTPYSFDASIWEIFLPLTTGSRSIVAEPGSHQDVGSLLQAVAEREVTVLQLVPSLLAVFLEQEGVRAGCFSLRRLFCGGEALPGELASRAAGRVDAELCNLYGPTEAAIDATFHRSGPVPERGTVPIGRPLANVQIHLLDAWGEPVPPGLAGELHIGGAGLARGYAGRPDLTASRFVPDPLGPAPGGRLYRTGDLARLSADGEAEFLGRVDQQVKVRGFRIELGEIEAVLAQHPGVREALVASRPEPAGEGVRLVAYVVAAPGDAPEPGELAAFLATKLPEHMVPQVFLLLPALPRLPSGKLDRQSLPEPAVRPSEKTRIAPRTPAEEILAGLWAELLDPREVSVDDDFFALGGHSLLATRLVARVRDVFRVELKVRDLFEAPTPEGFALRIAAAKRQGGALPPPLAPTLRDGPLPLSFAQQRLWFLDRLEPGSAAYNIAAALVLAGRLEPGLLAAALSAVAHRHESLRTVFGEVDGEPLQRVLAPAPVALPLVDLGGLPDAVRPAESRRLGRQMARAPFDLAAAPPLRVTLLRLADAEHLALFALHHIVTDGWSTAILVRELSALYREFVGGGQAALPELPIQYADYARWQREWLRGEVLAAELGYWRRQLAGAPPLELPADRPRPAVPSRRGGALPLAFPAAVGAALRELERRHGATSFMVLAAAFEALLSRYTGALDLCLGTPVAGRTHREVEGLIGFFVNTLVLRTDLTGDPAFTEILRRVRETTLDAYAHQEVPFERLVEDLVPVRSLRRPPLFQVMLAFQNAPEAAFELPGLAVSLLAAEESAPKFDLGLALGETAAGLAGTLAYDAERFDLATLERLREHFLVLVQGIVSDPGRRLSELPLLTGGEREEILRGWNRPTVFYPAGEELLHDLVAEQVLARPESAALTAAGAWLTYGELALRAEGVARRLRWLGVGPEAIVGIYAERSFALVLGVLGILRSGAAYLPLDPSLPAERLAWMLRDSGAAVLLTGGDELPEPLATSGLPVISTVGGARLPEPFQPAGQALPESPAYLIYTSGSTGLPKGVTVSHRAVVNRLRFAVAQDLLPGDRMLQKTTFAFDVSLYEIFGPLLVGGLGVLVRPGGQQDPEHLLDVLLEQDITQLTLPVSLLSLLIETPRFALCTGLRFVITGAETVPEDLPERLFARLKTRLLNRYGPTETTLSVTSWTCRPGEPERPLPIGRPIARAEIYVLDAAMSPVPVGVTGEIHIGGPGLARGYRNRPDLTAERFVPDPVGPSAGRRLYRTGDLGRFRPDGALDFLGRVDQQIKIRGFRVELEEIETVLGTHPAVARAIVAVQAENPADPRLVAYFVPRGAALPEASELRGFLKAKLPSYMVPTAFLSVGAFPLLPSGKIDRRALPTATAPLSTAAEPVPPRTPTEVALAAIWSEVLGVERIGAHDDFFDLGGHSLLATRVVARIWSALGVQLPVRELFASTTIAELAAKVEEELLAGSSDERLDELLDLLEGMDVGAEMGAE